MVDGLIAVIQSLGATFLRLIPISILLGLVFAVLTFSGRAIRGARGGASASL